MNSSIITKAGKIWLLTFAKSRQLFIALGSGNTEWSTDKQYTHAFDDVDNTLQLPYFPVSSVVVTPADSDEAFNLDTDYSVNLATGVVERLPGGNIEGDVSVKVAYHVEPAVEPYNQTQLLAELGRKKVLVKGFAVEDDEGDYWTTSGRYALTETPTELLILSVEFQPDELPNSNIREVGLFADPTFEEGVTDGQLFFEPDEIDGKGVMFGLNNIPTQPKGPATKIEIVIVWGL